MKELCCFLFILSALNYMPFSFLSPRNVFAEDVREKYQKIQKEIEAHKGKLEKTKRHERSVLEDLNQVSRKLNSAEIELRKQQRHLKQTETEAQKVEGEIYVNRQSLDKKRVWLKRRFQTMQRYGSSEDILFFLAITDNVSETMRRWKYLQKLALYERKLIDGYTENIRHLSERERHLHALRAEIKKEEDKIKLTEASLSEKKRNKEELLTAIRKEKSSYEKMLKEMEEASKQLLDALRRSDEKDTYSAKGFPALKGKLGWPVNGKVLGGYGSQKDPVFNISIYRNGIYIKADEKPVRVVYNGKVVFADWFKGYGNLLIVNHGEGYHTLYANLSEIFFKVGDIIKGKDVIGMVGNTGILNEPSLYFELRYKGKPLNPLNWLKRR